MALLITISNTQQFRPGVWYADLSPMEVRALGTAPHQGPVSLIEVTGEITDRNGVLEFDLLAAQVVSLGNSQMTFIVAVKQPASEAPLAPESGAEALDRNPVNSDLAFQRALAGLPSHVIELGTQLLSEVRKLFSGNLQPSSSGRFIETPDNFWTVKPQPRDRSLAVTVRGTTERFSVPAGIELKRDRASYSRFKVERLDQIPGAVSIIRQADRKR